MASAEYKEEVARRPLEPLIRWAGSKKKLIPLLKANMPKTFNKYIEPFCGSACLYFSLRPTKAVLSDINKELIVSYKTIKKDSKKITERLLGVEKCKTEYLRLRELDPSTLDEVERSYRFIYLNRFCFNGVYRTNREGRFNVPMGTKTGNLPTPAKISDCAKALKGASLIYGDFKKTLKYIEQGDFVYLDPPYTKEGAKNRGEYGHGSFNYQDIPTLISYLEKIDEKGAYFLLSYSCDSALLDLLPSRWYKLELSVNRHVAGFKQHRSIAKEVLVANYELASL
ncbi:DNA adenine methylase [Pseudomonas helmanticensis]|uniref:Site-specific DNA-methyltransferase (adenine-specific) n=1 Tax=Pseudomonas helmanticensis TaxID=1471381 RepID=A0A4R7UVX1_9PSED|nr:Dam family site-specific DNA-(adenine-N6)-methyltransferase [Pseudomonas helmanticensis]TDV40913.1 DNA adenine methylase [Pseudomonas helmanticensis]